jgi:hypothetical protein
MQIELSTLTFTDQDDMVPVSEEDEIINTGIANTLAGNDIIGTTNDYSRGITNTGVINAGADNDTLIGIGGLQGISNSEIIDTGSGKDIIIARGSLEAIFNNGGTINTGAGDDIINASGGSPFNGGHAIYNASTSFIDTGDGDDIITGIAGRADGSASYLSTGIFNYYGSIIDTGNGSDTITGIGSYGINNGSIIDTGNGEDSLISQGTFFVNYGGVFLGNDNDSIMVEAENNSTGYLQNFNAIETGDGNDSITTINSIFNYGIINTGDGDDSIIAGSNAFSYSIYNNGGAINMGNGNDSIITDRGFESGSNSSGAWFLGEGDDYIKGFGSGDFYGGNGNDTLEISLAESTLGFYRVGRWDDTTVTFSNNRGFMITSEFEKLIIGTTIYDFTNLTDGQTILVG